jgi:hypothetical protein
MECGDIEGFILHAQSRVNPRARKDWKEEEKEANEFKQFA